MTASIEARAQTPTRWRPPRMIETPLYRHGLTVLVVAYFLWSVGTLDIDWGRAARGVVGPGSSRGAAACPP